MKEEADSLGALRPIPYMGVIWVVAEAMKLGFYNGAPDWCNLGQGQPEVGEMEGAPPRLSRLEMYPGDHAYGPIGGNGELRQRIADHYNRLYREGLASKYGPENVSVGAGGRLMLSRVFASIAAGRVGYQIPDYTAYQDYFDYHDGRIEPVLIPTIEENGFGVPAPDFDTAVAGEKLSAYLVSNPCNPTGRVIAGDELRGYVSTARSRECTLVLDEFYSHFIYDRDGNPGAGPVSAAAYVDDVNEDPVLLVDGLTKSYRYPGWRVGWVVGPAPMIEILSRAGSAIDGGPGQPMQRAAIEILQPGRADQETRALREVFARKRNLMLERLQEFGLRPAPVTEGTFYVWASVAGLAPPLNRAEPFFWAALEHQVMTVPGHFFDVNPGSARGGTSPFDQWLRFSFGPPEDNVRMGLDRLGALLGRV